MSNNGLILHADNPQKLIKAYFIGRNTLESDISIVCKKTMTTLGQKPIEALNDAVLFFNPITNAFASSQYNGATTQYAYSPLANKLKMHPYCKYFCSVKEANDIRCVAAEIAEILKVKMGKDHSLNNAIRVYQKWINKYFTYKVTGEIEDHSAVSLLKRRAGVCQAIASLTVLVFPYLGFPAQYVRGKTRQDDNKETHGWNAIKDGDRWIHADFTFGMNSMSTPQTATEVKKLLFMHNHFWDAGIYNDKAFSYGENVMKELASSTIKLFGDSDSCFLNDVLIEAGTRLLISNEDGSYDICLSKILALIGGACDYQKSTGQLRICLYDHQIVIADGAKYLSKRTGYLKASILLEISEIKESTKDSITIQLK